MNTVGITGGIGSGKTLVCKVFSCFGVPVYHSDRRARLLTENNPVILKAISEVFGPEIISSGKLDRDALAEIVFRDKIALEKLNAIVHPVVRKDVETWINRMSGEDYIIQEAAILFETGAYRKMDAVISVSAPLEVRISRVMARDLISRQQVLERMHSQLEQAEIDEKADLVIHNDGERMLIPQIAEIHGKILRKELFL